MKTRTRGCAASTLLGTISPKIYAALDVKERKNARSMCITDWHPHFISKSDGQDYS
jgi:hypothetical protein